MNPDAREVEAYTLAGASYAFGKRMAGDAPLSAEPFADLALAPAALRA